MSDGRVMLGGGSNAMCFLHEHEIYCAAHLDAIVRQREPVDHELLAQQEALLMAGCWAPESASVDLGCARCGRGAVLGGHAAAMMNPGPPAAEIYCYARNGCHECATLRISCG